MSGIIQQSVNNSRLILIFSYLKTLREIQGSNGSVIALNKVIESMEQSSFQIQSGEHAKTFIQGVGNQSIQYINGILRNTDPTKSGIYELDNLDELTKHKLLTIFEMTKIPGVGVKIAKQYYENGIKDIETLKIFLQNGGGTTRQQIGIKYIDEFKKRIPREKVTFYLSQFELKLNEYNNYNKTQIRYEVGGSYLRGKETSGDIDIILWSLIPRQVIYNFTFLSNYLKSSNLLKETLSQGEDSYQGVAYIDEEYPAVRIDFKMLANLNEYYYAVLFFTGSAKFNQEMRDKAKSMGLTLGNNEMTINATGEKIYVRNEKDIFDLLEIEWKPPSER